MTVPAVPFWASQALAEFGLGPPGWASDLAGRGGGPGVPFWLSEFAGRSNYTPMSVTISPSYADTSAMLSTGASTGFTCNVSGGAGPYSFSWSLVSANGSGSQSLSSSTAQSVSSSISGVTRNQDRSVVWRCNVTDGAGYTVGATCQHYHAHQSLD